MPEPLAYPQWLMFGDSITQQSFAPGGLGQALADDYQRRMDIVNRGYGGYNSLWGLEVVPHVFPRTSAGRPLKVLSIWWGANDACLPMRSQSIPLDQFKDNIDAMIDRITSKDSPYYSPDTTIILFSCPPICESQRKEDVAARLGPGIELDRSAERTRDFAYAMKEVAEKRKVGFVNVFDAMMKAAGSDSETGLRRLLSDGLHLTAQGYQVVYDELKQVLKSSYPHLLVDNVPRLFPDWSVIDPKDPSASFSNL